MRNEAFQLLHDAEISWWYRGRARAVRKVLERLYACEGPILDFGAGFGGMYRLLSRFGKVNAFEPNPLARDACRERGYSAVFFEEAEARAAGPYSLVALFDVLEHSEDDALFLDMIGGALIPSGRIIITVPAYKWLWGTHDVSHHHYRRYSKDELAALLMARGFETEYIGYWNMLLFIPAALVRLLGRSGEGSLAMPKWIDRIFYFLIVLESNILQYFPLPFGTGVIALARKKQ